MLGAASAGDCVEIGGEQESGQESRPACHSHGVLELSILSDVPDEQRVVARVIGHRVSPTWLQVVWLIVQLVSVGVVLGLAVGFTLAAGGAGIVHYSK